VINDINEVYQQAIKLFGEADKINLWGLQDLEGFDPNNTGISRR
jgi:hypothetical protein